MIAPNGSQMTLENESEEYKAFVNKFKRKKTTDDCYTPPAIYGVVLDYVVNRYGIDRNKVVRPFWPDGDFMRDEYPCGCVVVDNPPFSMLTNICTFYLDNNIKFFLFAPTLTLLHASGTKRVLEVNHIVCSASITYENGAKVATSFVTNMDTDGTVLESAPELSDAIKRTDAELQREKTKKLDKYVYPDEVITAAKVNYFAAHHTPYRLNKNDCCPIAKLDAMNGKTIFGGGLLLSKRAAAERAAAERAAAERAAAEDAEAVKWKLSEREKRLVDMLGERGADNAE